MKVWLAYRPHNIHHLEKMVTTYAFWHTQYLENMVITCPSLEWVDILGMRMFRAVPN